MVYAMYLKRSSVGEECFSPLISSWLSELVSWPVIRVGAWFCSPQSDGADFTFIAFYPTFPDCLYTTRKRLECVSQCLKKHTWIQFQYTNLFSSSLCNFVDSKSLLFKDFTILVKMFSFYEFSIWSTRIVWL